MAFNVDSFIESNNPAANAAVQFGVPACALNLAGEALGLLPTPALIALRMSTLQGKMAAEQDIQALIGWIRDTFGLHDIIDENGRLAFQSKFSLFGIDIFSVFGQVAGYIQAITAFGSAIYRDYQAIGDKIDEIKDCLDSFKKSTDAQTAGAANGRTFVIGDRTQGELAFLDQVSNFIDRSDAFIRRIDAELRRRAENPDLEPVFNGDIDTSGLLPLFTDRIVTSPKELFRLSYGPPKSKKGIFILSIDGIYYDSQTSGLSPVFTELSRRKSELDYKFLWDFKQDPNLGGRGQGISNADIKDYVNSVLDVTKINDSEIIRKYYDEDNYLEQLLAQRNKRIYDLSSHITILEDDVNASEADIFNLRQSLLSENATYQTRINKRKKQIELAVAFGGRKYKPGQIPLNDFSYLANKNVLFEIEKQRQLVLDFDDVDGIILPVSATFVSPPKDNVITNLEHLVLSLVGEGNIPTGASSYDSSTVTDIPLMPRIETNNLLAVYNFLETNIELPSSTQYLLDNCITNNNTLNGRLISSSIESVFRKGLGIPYLNGLVSLDLYGNVTGLNNAVVLRETKQLNDLMYSKEGATLDFWIHAPSIKPATVGSIIKQYQIILANENFGILPNEDPQPNIDYIRPNYGAGVVRGMLMGFTRDRRITEGLPASETDGLNYASATCFFIAPTQSADTSTIGFINKSDALAIEDCSAYTLPYAFTFNINQRNAEGQAFSSITTGFQHVAVNFNPKENQISVYLNGTLMATSGMNEVFPVNKNQMPRIPTFIKQNSFKYNQESLPNASTYFHGIEPVRYTPWVIGGGYTDGFPDGNFLGNKFGGQQSGLNGYLGSFKFYNKSLSVKQIINNYEAQKSFFRNIDI